MATSLALLAGAGWASAQAPQWETKSPAKTNWAPFPMAAPKATTAPVVAPPILIPPVEQPSQLGTRVILFQKPAEAPLEPKAAQPKMAEPTVAPALPAKAEPSKDEVFRMAGDDVRHAAILKLANTQTPTTMNPAPARTAATPPRQALLEPGYVVHRRLFFEDKNSERYGWDLGMIQPFVSAGYFYKDLLLWPSHLGSNLRERYSTNAGKFLPGSPVPYFIYPSEITLVGAALGALAIGGAVAIMP